MKSIPKVQMKQSRDSSATMPSQTVKKLTLTLNIVHLIFKAESTRG